MEKLLNRSSRDDKKTIEKMYTTLFLLQQQIGNHLLGTALMNKHVKELL
jgi:hypothetical protein